LLLAKYEPGARKSIFLFALKNIFSIQDKDDVSSIFPAVHRMLIIIARSVRATKQARQYCQECRQCVTRRWENCMGRS